ncbi:structural protein P5 [Dysgonomonas sp. BGC7]|uniref:structural protein P5 n=1 Tax=Dysgonomonas sp. BGC7 TaxID=1658008 RepID=UPI0006805D61|nr:structural protein P5 [Dysgonomonas sp. BGC7]MBD8390500.1 structural protein P5 [Dysgonomonas sp. BGC7]
MKSQTRGYLNNNPGNIELNKDKFQGEVIPSRDKRFKQFQSMAYGYRAMFVTLHTYLTKYQRNTIEKIVKAWAPPQENHTQVYINSVEKWSGVLKDKILTEYSAEDYINIVAAMSRMENGVIADMADVKRGFVLQDRIK